MHTLSRNLSSVVAASILLALSMESGAAQSASRINKYVGEWTYSDEYSTNYLRITDAGGGRFRLVTGFLYQGKITWDPTLTDNGDGIYLRPKRGTLEGAFDSSNFRPSHGNVVRYTIRIAMRPDGNISYTVGGVLEDPHVATRTSLPGMALPAAFPRDIPIYPGATILGAAVGATGKGASLSTTAGIGTVAAHYKARLPKLGWTDVRSTTDGSITQLSASKGRRVLKIGIMNGADGMTIIALGETPKP